MFCERVLLLLILTVTMVTKSAVAQGSRRDCPEVTSEFGARFTDCGPDENPQSYVMCCLRGDPHITTFDRFKYNFGVKGYFVAVGPCEGQDIGGLEIVVYMEPRKVNPEQYRIVGVRITKGGIIYNLTFQKKKKVFTVDAEVRDLEAGAFFDTDSVAYIDPRKSSEIIIRCPEVKIRINTKFHSVYIWIRRTFLDQGVCGLCGYYNNIESDDTDCMQNCPQDCSNNVPTCPVDDFGNLWMVDD